MHLLQIPDVTTFEQTKIVGIENIDFGKNIIIDDFVFIHAKKRMVIGNHVHIATFTSITGGEALTMGDFSALSSGVRLLTGTDDFKSWGFGNSTLDEKYRNTQRLSVHIGQFAVVGANSVILPGVNIGEGASIGAGSVITRDVEAWGIYIGNRRIGERDKNGVLRNYRRFLTESASSEIAHDFDR
ncbi:MAG: acyltransferase [Phormidesmis sp.]